jgi:hypothetical protein
MLRRTLREQHEIQERLLFGNFWLIPVQNKVL